MAAAPGLHPAFTVVPVAATVGPYASRFRSTVRAAVLVLPQASLAVNVRVCVRVQPLLVTALSADVTVAALHVSVAVALPSAASMAAVLGLQPAFNVVPVAVTVGPVVSRVQLTVRAAVLVLPQASLAVNVRVCVRVRPL